MTVLVRFRRRGLSVLGSLAREHGVVVSQTLQQRGNAVMPLVSATAGSFARSCMTAR